MACAPALMQQEDNFFKVLATVFRHDVTDLNTLVLEGKDGKRDRRQKVNAIRFCYGCTGLV
jgi:heat shock protein HslJ